MAVEHLRQGRAGAAEPILRRLLQSYPNEPDINLAVGMLHGLKGEPQKATPYLQKAVRLRPSAQSLTNLAGNYAELGREEEAMAAFRKALQLEPDNLAASVNLAALYLKRDAFSRALPLLERVVRARPGIPETGYMLALCYSALGRPEQARRTLLALPAKARQREEIQLLLGAAALALGRREEAQGHFESALKINPDSVQGAANLGALLVKGGDTKRGLEMLQSAWKKDPASYLAGYNLALGYRQTGNPEGARSVLATLLTKGETGELYNLLGEVEAELKNNRDAVTYLQRAVELDSSETHLFDLGYFFLKQWVLDQALAVFRRGAEKFPKSARLWMGLGSAYFAQANHEEAINAYLRATQYGDDPRAWRFLGAAYMAINLPRADVAARLHKHRLAHPQDAWANLYDGCALSRSGDLEQALPALRRALELDPKLAEAHFELGNIHSQQGRQEEAIAAYQAAVKINPEYAQAYHRLGQAYSRAGRKAEAEAALSRHEELRRRQAVGNEKRLRETIEFIYRAPDR